jgi:hypothetical protein
MLEKDMIDNFFVLATCGGIVVVAIRAIVMERRQAPPPRARR